MNATEMHIIDTVVSDLRQYVKTITKPESCTLPAELVHVNELLNLLEEDSK